MTLGQHTDGMILGVKKVNIRVRVAKHIECDRVAGVSASNFYIIMDLSSLVQINN